MSREREGPCREDSDQRTRGRKWERERYGRQSGALKDWKLKSKEMEILPMEIFRTGMERRDWMWREKAKETERFL